MLLAVRAGEVSGGTTRTEILGVHLTRETVPPTSTTVTVRTTRQTTTTRGSPDTTLTVETLPAGPVPTDAPVPTIATEPGHTSTTTSRATTTTVPNPPPGVVVEESDNTAEYIYDADGSGGAKTTPDNQPPTDPLTFLVAGNWDHDNVAHLQAKLDNNTEHPITFPGDGKSDGLVLRFLMDLNGQPWRTVEVRNSEVRTLPPHFELEVTASVAMDKYGTYDLSAEAPVQYGS